MALTGKAGPQTVSVYRNLIRHTSIYAVALVARRLASVFLLPVYTRYLTPSDYGVTELLDLMSGILTAVFAGRLADGLMYFYAHAKSDEEKVRITHTALLTGHFFGLVGGVLGWLAAPWASLLMFQSRDYTFFCRLVFISYAFILPGEVGFGYLRARNRSSAAMVLSVLRLAVNVGATVALLVGYRMGISAILYSALIASVLVAVYMDVTLLRGPITLDRGLAVRLCRYSFPIGLSAFGIGFIHSGDRFFLQRYATLADVGLYGLAYKLGMLVGYVQVPFETYWDAQVFHVVRENSGDRHFVRMLTYFVLALFGAATAISLFAAPVLRIFTTGPFHSAALLVPVIAFAYAVRGPGDYFRSVFAISNQPSKNVTVTLLGVALTVVSYLALIPPYRAWGAAAATAITFLGMGMIAYWQAERIRKFRYEWRRMLQIALSSIGVVVAAILMRPDSLFGQLAFASLGTLAFPTVLYVTGFFEPAELAELRSQLQTLLPAPKMAPSSEE